MKNTTRTIVFAYSVLIGLLLLLPFWGKCQTIQYTSGVPHTAGAPVSTPSTFGSWLRYDKTNKVLYRWTGSAWASMPSSSSLSDGDYGDISVSGSGVTWNIDSGVVGSSELASTAVTPGTYGSATQVPQITVDADGRITGSSNVSITGLSIPGAFIGVQVLTSSGTYTPSTGTGTVNLVLVGGGGGGGGVRGSAASAGAGGGGGAGGLCIKTFSGVTGTYTYTIGSGGGGGTGAGPSVGSNGTATTFVNGGTTYRASPGVGGSPCTLSAALQIRSGGDGGGSSNGDLNCPGQAGGYGINVSTTTCISGSGGTTPYGGGGIPVNSASAAGNNGSGYGSGGSGAAAVGNVNNTGGSGANGVIIVFEYK